MLTRTGWVDIALEQGLPANVEAERLILGAILMDGTHYSIATGALDADDFSLEKHRRIFQRMAELYARGERIERVTLAEELRKHSQLELVGGLTYICSLDEGLPQVVNIDSYTRIITEKATLRRIVFACRDLIDRCCLAQEAPAELLSDGEVILRKLGVGLERTGNLATAHEIISELDMNALGKAQQGGVKTPYGGLNRNIAGLMPGELIVLGARPSAGKSAMAMEMALHAAAHGQRTAVFSLEMRKNALITRCACNRGSVDRNRLDYGELDSNERREFTRALNQISELPLHLDDRSHTFAAMAREVRRMPETPRLLVVDHLHLMRGSSKSENRNNELAQITRELKLFAGEMGISILLLAQLSRASEKDSRPPEMRDLRDCGAIEADADIVLFLHRKQETLTEADKGKPVQVELRIAKQRDGRAFIKFPMLLYGPHYHFEESL